MPRRQTSGSTSKTSTTAKPLEAVDPISGQISQRVKLLRQQRGWSQEELAEACGLHRTYVGSIERAERNVGIDLLGRFALAFGISTNELLNVPLGPEGHNIKKHTEGH